MNKQLLPSTLSNCCVYLTQTIVGDQFSNEGRLLVVDGRSQHQKPWYEMTVYVQVVTSQERTEPTTKLL